MLTSLLLVLREHTSQIYLSKLRDLELHVGGRENVHHLDIGLVVNVCFQALDSSEQTD